MENFSESLCNRPKNMAGPNGKSRRSLRTFKERKREREDVSLRPDRIKNTTIPKKSVG